MSLLPTYLNFVLRRLRYYFTPFRSHLKWFCFCRGKFVPSFFWAGPKGVWICCTYQWPKSPRKIICHEFWRYRFVYLQTHLLMQAIATANKQLLSVSVNQSGGLSMEISVLYLSHAMFVRAELIVYSMRGLACILAKWFWPTVMSLSLTYGSPEASCIR